MLPSISLNFQNMYEYTSIGLPRTDFIKIRNSKIPNFSNLIFPTTQTIVCVPGKGKRPDSPGKYKLKDLTKRPPTGAVYVDLAYIPHHGHTSYTNSEFFKKIRARHYVFSGIEPSKQVFNALLEAKQTWEDKDLGKTIKSDIANRKPFFFFF